MYKWLPYLAQHTELLANALIPDEFISVISWMNMSSFIHTEDFIHILRGFSNTNPFGQEQQMLPFKQHVNIRWIKCVVVQHQTASHSLQGANAEQQGQMNGLAGYLVRYLASFYL